MSTGLGFSAGHGLTGLGHAGQPLVFEGKCFGQNQFLRCAKEELVFSQEPHSSLLPLDGDGRIGHLRLILQLVAFGMLHANGVAMRPHVPGDILQLFDQGHCPAFPRPEGVVPVKELLLTKAETGADAAHEGVPAPQSELCLQSLAVLGKADQDRGVGGISDPRRQESNDAVAQQGVCAIVLEVFVQFVQ